MTPPLDAASPARPEGYRFSTMFPLGEDATPYLKLFALAQGGTGLARKALGLRGEDAGAAALATARFFAEHNAAEAPGLELAVTEGAGAVADSAAVFAA